MKVIVKLIFILLIGTSINAQKINSGKITYYIPEVSLLNERNNVDITNMIAMTKRQHYQLDFNKGYSSFLMVGVMDREEYSEFYISLAKNFVSYADIYYDYNNRRLIEVVLDGTLLESKMQQLPWHITTETKIIDQYQCYKATYTFDYLARDQKLKTTVVTAWFAPSLPYSYGPKNYHGLPGLILELTDNSVTFLVSKIELLTEEIQIKFPKGKVIQKEEFEKAILKN